MEGWYGQPWGKPYWRIKDYVDDHAQGASRREAPVAHEGREISLPYTGPGAMGVGKPLKSILHMNPDIPIYLGTGNEATVKLTAEIADGWLPLGFVPGSMPEYRPWLEEGFRRAGGGKGFGNFAIQGQVHVEIDSDVKAALARLKPEVALYVGGMGHRDKNFHKDLMIRRGYKAAAERIQELYLAHRKDEAAAAVPDEWVDAKSLVGPPERIKQRYRAWADSGLTGLSLRFPSSPTRGHRGDGRGGGPQPPLTSCHPGIACQCAVSGGEDPGSARPRLDLRSSPARRPGTHAEGDAVRTSTLPRAFPEAEALACLQAGAEVVRDLPPTALAVGSRLALVAQRRDDEDGRLPAAFR